VLATKFTCRTVADAGSGVAGAAVEADAVGVAAIAAVAGVAGVAVARGSAVRPHDAPGANVLFLKMVSTKNDMIF
jgi:uncharacterized membrane protein (DUF441 family)